MNKYFTIYMDSLKEGFGTMLIQYGGLIVNASRKLKKHMELYSTHDLELVVVMLDLNIWRNYLVG
jgi:hypothetical protein